MFDFFSSFAGLLPSSPDVTRTFTIKGVHPRSLFEALADMQNCGCTARVDVTDDAVDGRIAAASVSGMIVFEGREAAVIQAGHMLAQRLDATPKVAVPT